ncbi:SGNH/GDSL hydrolase family protein [Pedobacter mucosus]|uniref:SGNH/GDSL hydrolase family protein n=1 Tax=Pedobacter mucosus TaxID=2895286 RepID=UPI001EE430B7|nr:SGNH/GDSL hydrolase family protein [Pedobacter mucosus]UKT62680.1 SGNH/GDSL hydrolase family protein [Pedobacter mucosus]
MNFFKRSLLFLMAICLLTSFKKKELTWLAIGDSITYLNDHVNETGNRVTKGYLTGVAERISGLRYLNKGYNGWTSGNVANKIESLGLTKADVYSIFLGTNDWWQGRPVGSLEDYKSNQGSRTLYGSFRIIIDKIHSLNPEAKILLITPMQRADFVYVNDAKNNAFGSYQPKSGQYLETFAEAIVAIGKYEKIEVIDLYHHKLLQIRNMVYFKKLKNPETGLYVNYKFPESTEIPFNPLSDEYPYPLNAINLTYDGLHPSDKGNKIIANIIAKRIKKMNLENL